MKRRRPVHLTFTPSEKTAVPTGAHCPVSGWWYPLKPGSATVSSTAASAARFIGEGSVMPAMAGTPVLWLPGREQPTAATMEELAR